ncbi:capsid triplex subunit 1 [Gallid alphaherpesvirus 1]|uniref:Capsid triplex subunit 1 n=2 Tax=Infectious laryngotracheitis virus TaxID=10386 RepID=F5B4T8_ILTV|nr:capsid triplex subunit 1 [Gallid alphaherpesvirus 1]AEW67782.1 capsid triplex subunit 1 [Gallid alphaherpesvirus 1]AEW67861.1 capsid triplex subunit 1 [Gallid alphaherpesvirus 1]AFD36579.1 UL38 protein [Gallid alphaherpesvirus 1]AFD36658.1 UL38 protein [Gallid alphaherpesvirus 1]
MSGLLARNGSNDKIRAPERGLSGFANTRTHPYLQSVLPRRTHQHNLLSAALGRLTTGRNFSHGLGTRPGKFFIGSGPRNPEETNNATLGKEDTRAIASKILLDVESTRTNDVISLTQITVIDLCQPGVEESGSLMLFLKGVKDLLKILGSRPAREQIVRDLETAFINLNRACGLSVTGESAVKSFELSAVSLSFVAAAGAAHYRNNCGVEALRAFVIANYKDSAITEKLANFDALLLATIEARAYPHFLLSLGGGLIKATESETVTCMRLLVRGTHEAAAAGDLSEKKCAVLHFPACLLLDLDEGFCPPRTKINAEGGVYFLHLLFLYSTDMGHPSYELYVAKTSLPESCMRDILNERFTRRRINNTIASLTHMQAQERQAFPPFNIAEAAVAARMDLGRERSRHPLDPVQGRDQRLRDMQITSTGIPDHSALVFAAYCMLGTAGSIGGEPSFSTIQKNGTSLKYVHIRDFNFRGGPWNVCM